MAVGQQSSRREGLSVQTLVIAALASAVAAIVTSTFWRGGTIVAAAMTPVIVSIVKELLARPLESDLVRRPVSRVREANPRVRRFERDRVPAQVGARRADVPRDPIASPNTPGDHALATGPIRTYGRRRRLRIGVAVATGVVAFAIAVFVLTVPELIFGGSVASHGGTTLFGGQSRKATAPTHTTTGGSPTPTTTSPKTPTSTAPQQQTPPTSTSQAPTSTNPQQSPPQQSPPAQTPPSGGTPPGK